MKVDIGEKGLTQSWQEKFPPEIKCHKCGKQARIMFVAHEFERGEGIEFVCELRKTTGKNGGLWVHDAIACANYLCPHCFEVTAELNQA